MYPLQPAFPVVAAIQPLPAIARRLAITTKCRHHRCKQPLPERMSSHRFGVSRGGKPLDCSLSFPLVKGRRRHRPFLGALRLGRTVSPLDVPLCPAALPKVQSAPAHRLTPTPFWGVQRGATTLERGFKGVSPFDSSSIQHSLHPFCDSPPPQLL